VDVEVPNNKEGEPKVWEKNLWWDGVDPMINSIGGVDVNNPKGVEVSAKKRFDGGDVEGEDTVHSPKPGEHCVTGQKRHMNVGSHSWLSTGGKEGLKTIKGRKVSLVDGRVL